MTNWTADAIKKLRLNMRLLQPDFAKLLRVDAGTVSRWERALARPRLQAQRKLDRLERELE